MFCKGVIEVSLRHNPVKYVKTLSLNSFLTERPTTRQTGRSPKCQWLLKHLIYFYDVPKQVMEVL